MKNRQYIHEMKTINNSTVCKRIACILLVVFSVSNMFAQSRGPVTYTPQGSEVNLINNEELLTPAAKASHKAEWAQKYPRAIYMGEATFTYNCHAYAWSVSEGGAKYWMGSTEVNKYWTDGSYVQTYTSDPKATKVFYANDDHSAIITSGNYFISKWGASCLMEHWPADCPYNSSNLKYYKLSMEISGDRFVELANTNSVVTKQYKLSNVPVGATVEWTVTSRGTILSGQGSNTIQVSINGTGQTTISAKVNCPTGIVVKIPFDVNVISSSAPIITDIELLDYGLIF